MLSLRFGRPRLTPACNFTISTRGKTKSEYANAIIHPPWFPRNVSVVCRVLLVFVSMKKWITVELFHSFFPERHEKNTHRFLHKGKAEWKSAFNRRIRRHDSSRQNYRLQHFQAREHRRQTSDCNLASVEPWFLQRNQGPARSRQHDWMIFIVIAIGCISKV